MDPSQKQVKYAAVVKSGSQVRQPAGQSIFQRLQFLGDYCANFRDEIDEFLGIDHSILSQSVLHGSAERVLWDTHSNFRRQHQPGVRLQGANSVNHSSNIDGRGFLGRDHWDAASAPKISDQLRKQDLQSSNQFDGKCFRCLGWGHQ
jgi:hypothetical protein